MASAGVEPSGLLIEGEAGIGKTTLWLAGVDQARERGFRVLTARAGQAESVMAYAAVADLLSDVDSAIFDGLPELQRLAIDRVLLRAEGEGPETNQRVTAAAFLSIIGKLSAEQPVLVAIDDLQWLDSSSQPVVAFAVKRFNGRVGLLVTERTGPSSGHGPSWLQLADPVALRRIRVSPLSLGGLQTAISQRLGRRLPRPTMTRISEISGGNPFYALELARAMDGEPVDGHSLPGTLAELVQMRIGRVNQEARDMLLTAACVADPTVDVLARATTKTANRVVEVLEEPEANGIVAIDGNRVRFTHPLLARGVYTQAAPAHRRRSHRALADVVTQPELRARHLALATSSPEPGTLEALDAAAKAARVRGAPAAAAELLDLAIKLGGDTPARRMKAAEHHIRAGDTRRALEVLDPAIKQLPPGPKRAGARLVRAAILINTEGNGPAADVLKLALDDAKDNPLILVPVRLMLSFALAPLGRYDEALHHAEQARTEVDGLAIPSLVSSVLANWVFVSFVCGLDFDRASMERALELEDFQTEIPISFRASAVNALMLMWTGQLDEAAAQMDAVRRRHLERGADTEMFFVSLNSTMLNLMRGCYREAAEDATDSYERAERLGGSDYLRSMGLTMRGAVAVYTGREAEARADLAAAIDAGLRSRSLTSGLDVKILAELELSLGRYAEALALLQPLLAAFDVTPNTEVNVSSYLPIAIEALVMLGRLDEAEPFIDALDRNGRERDRAWMLANAACCRSLLLAARGEVDAALCEAHRSLTEYDRLSMPLERARAQLVLGQLQRRQRQKQVAAATLNEALHTFDELGSPLWAERARAELARTNVAPGRGLELTPSEQRVAELAASGMTNRDIGAKLFVSAKTVEANLTQIYRKLGIRSRAELGRLMGEQRSGMN